MSPCHLARPDRRQDAVEGVVLGDVGVVELRLRIAQVDGTPAEDLDNSCSEAGLALE